MKYESFNSHLSKKKHISWEELCNLFLSSKADLFAIEFLEGNFELYLVVLLSWLSHSCKSIRYL